MLAAQYRLRRSRDIARVYKRGVYGGAEGLLSLKAAPNGRAESRIVVVVAKKIDKRAVTRNRIRRRLVELLRQSWETVPPGYDIVISAHADLSALPSRHLRQLLDTACRRARLSAS